MLFLDKLIEHQESYPDAFALVSSSRKVTYYELAEIVKSGSIDLMSRNILPGDVVGISIHNELEHMIASLCLLSIGASQIVLASHDTEELRKKLANRAGMKFVLTDKADYELDNISTLKWDNIDFHKANSLPVLKNNQGRLFLSTSGTTGSANLILFTEVQLSLQAMRHQDYKNERLLRLAHVEYNASKRHRLYSLWNGGANFFSPSFKIQEAMAFAAAHHISYLDISRMHVRELIALNNPSLFLGISIRTGGAEVPNELRKLFLSNVSSSLYVRYATTETGAIAMATPSNHNDDEATSGFPLDNVDVQIVDSSGIIKQKGEVGEIRLRAPGMATEYYDNPAQTELRFRGGWFYPNDMGYLTDDGQVVIICRKDDMINLNGINIFPADIERVLESHPSVSRAVALGIPSTTHGQIPVAAVMLNEGHMISELDLYEFAREYLALRHPRKILILDKFPVNHQGKVVRHELKLLFSGGKNKKC